MPELRERLQEGLADSYTIGRELGRGGMATVFLAHDLKLDRSVALKVLRPELASLVGPERFLREISLTSHLRHPNILPLFDSGQANGFLFYTMPWVQGESLRQRLNREPQLPVDDTIQIAREVADALSHAHAQGIIHRDIKPENILLEGGHAVVADFGVAKALTNFRSEISSDGMAIGTALYMSPEQGSASPHIDGRADVYSLGCVVYEMLAGVPPFNGPTAQAIAARHALDPVPSLRTVRSTVPVAVEQVILRALAKVPADRFGSAAEFRDALGKAAQGSTPGIMRRWMAPVVPAVILIILLSWLVPPRPQPPHDSTSTAQMLGAGVSATPRVAVLYFEDNTSDSSLRLFADGLTEELIHELSGVNAFQVISRNGVRPFRDHQIPFDSMVARLGVSTVIDGSVRREGDSLMVGVDLINATSGTQVDRVSVKRRLTDILSLEREVALQVAAALRRRMGREVRLRNQTTGTRSALARELVLKARRARDDAEALMAETDPAELSPALSALRRADSLLALAGQVDRRWLRPVLDRGWVALQMAGALRTGDRVATFEKGLTLSEEAVRRDKESAEALQLRGTARWSLVVQQLEAAPSDTTRLSSAEVDLRAALDRDSTLAGAWATLSYLLWFKGRFAEADIAAQRALHEDGYLADAREIYLQLFFGNLMTGQVELAGDWCRRGRLSSPGDWRFVECALTVMRNDQHARPNPDSAWALVQALERLDPARKAVAEGRGYHSMYRRIVAATISARAGDHSTARTELQRALRTAETDSSLRLDLAYDEAYLRLVLGEREKAESLLHLIVAARPVLASLLADDPLFAKLRTGAEGASPPR